MTEVVEEIKKTHLPSASAGGDNAYYLRNCPNVNRMPAYASCLHKIGEIEAGRTNETWSECISSIKGRSCRALGMRQEEQLKGVALYYVPRQLLQRAQEANVPLTQSTVKGARKWAPPPPPKKDLDARLTEHTSAGYAAALNAAVKSLPSAATPTAAAKTQPPPTARPPMQPGETPLQYARRIAAAA